MSERALQCSKVPTCHSLLFVMRVVLRRNWVCGLNGMTLTRQTEVLTEKRGMAQGQKPGLRCEKPATDCLSHGTIEAQSLFR